MKTLAKLSVIAFTFTILAGCTGSSYNKEKDCTMDYLLHPVISVPAIIGACD